MFRIEKKMVFQALSKMLAEGESGVDETVRGCGY
jgi:hypothetical protein